MRIVFLGTSDFAVSALGALASAGHVIPLVVTQPDRPAGRGRKLRASPIKVKAMELGLRVYQPEKINTRLARATIREAEPDVLVVASFGQILRPLALALAPHGCLNVHASILPRHRGASPINAAILEGDAEVGVTIMRMDEGLDSGDIALVGTLPADPRETAGQLHDRLAVEGGRLIVKAIAALQAGTLTFTPQDHDAATHAGLIAKDAGHLDFGADATTLDRRIRGLTPWPGATCDLVNTERTIRLTIEAAEPLAEAAGAPGSVIAVERDAIVVACGEGGLRVTAVRPSGKRGMAVRDFLNGTPVAIGDRMEMPS